jgi:glycosyltransferase involved in cell wall biosynthesis
LSSRILLVQYAGDYREAYHRLANGGTENYRGQRYTIDAVGEIAKRYGPVATLIYQTPEKYQESLPNGVTAIGIGLKDHPKDFRPILDEIELWKPTHLILRCLSSEVLEWSTKQEVRTLAVLAETHTSGWLRWWRNRKLAKRLNQSNVEWVANHHLNATQWLKEIGVQPEKLIPYDYEYGITPNQFPAKHLREQGPWIIAYVGMLIDGKGIPELLQAMDVLNRDHFSVRLRLAGSGDTTDFQRVAEKYGIADRVEFVGTIPNDQVVEFMRSADMVVVPSRASYSESFGFVVQEAFLSRTPVIVSDHRAFQGRVIQGETGLIFPSGNGAALAKKMKELLTNPTLYQQLSENSARAWQQMQIPVKWAELIFRWLENTPESIGWLRDHRLESSKYQRSS